MESKTKKSVNRLEKLVKEYERLSYAEKGRFLQRTGIVVMQPLPEEQSYVSYFEQNIEDALPLPVGESPYSFDYYLWGMKMTCVYDRGELTEYLKALLTVDEIILAYKADGDFTISLEHPRKFFIGQDEDNLLQILPIVIFNKGTDQEEKLSLFAAFQRLRTIKESSNPYWTAWFEQIDREVPAFEAAFSEFLPFAFAQGAAKLIQELSASVFYGDENHEMPAAIHDWIKLWRPFFSGRQGPGWKNRPKNNSGSQIPPEFVPAVDNCFDLVKQMKDTYTNHASDDWRSIIRALGIYQGYVEKNSAQYIDEVMELLPRRIEDNTLRDRFPSSYSKIVSPLAFACELAARKTGFQKPDGQYYEALTLIDKYREAGGQRRASANQYIN